MSHSVPQQQSLTDAARGEAPSAPADRPLPGFPQHAPPSPHSPIEREIERSERASAALAATRALARASFTDSQLAADDAANHPDDADIDTAGWIRTEYAGLDQTLRHPQDDAEPAAPRNFVGGTFNPGIASLQGRAFPSASLAHAPIKTRTGAQARFLQEARQTPRGERAPNTMSLATGQSSYDKPAVVPMLAPAMAPLPAKASAAVAARPRAQAGESLKFMLAAGLGAVVVLIAGGVAWKAGVLPHNSSSNAAAITAQVAAQAEAARLLSTAAPQPIAIAPAAGPTPTRSNEEIDAALAAAARAAAVPVASVRAADASRVAHPLPVAAPVAAALAPAAKPAVAPAKSKESVADAIARAQARSDSFLTSGNGAVAPADVKQAP